MRESATRDVWVLKTKDGGKYLAPTVLSKFGHVTMGDLVVEQLYAKRFYDRNEAVVLAVEIGHHVEPSEEMEYKIVRLVSGAVR